jgi:hypothetical protein
MASNAPTAERAFEQSIGVAREVDENINRLLAVISFLAIGGFTLFVSNTGGHLHFDNSGVDASEIFFFLFDVGVFFTVAFALVALEFGSGETDLFFLSDSPSTSGDGTFEAGARHFATVARRKAAGLSRSRASIEFSMISLALLGSAKLPHLSQHTKTWLVTCALALYGFGAAWRLKGSDLAFLRTMYLGVSALAAALLFLAFPFHAHWWAIAYALGWIGGSRIAGPRNRGSHWWTNERLFGACLAFAVGIGILVYLVVTQS